SSDLHVSDPFICAAIGAGAALLPDLDESGSTVGRSLGVVTEGVSRLLRSASRAVYQATGTPYELRDSRSDGGHRYLTHTIPAAVAFGLVAWGLAASMPLGVGLVVLGMASMGLATVARTLKAWGTVRQREMVALGAAGARSRRGWGPVRQREVVVLGAAALATAGAVVGDGGAPWLMGLTVGVGAFVHLLGDWLTRSGVPLAWPLVHPGKRWWMFRS